MNHRPAGPWTQISQLLAIIPQHVLRYTFLPFKRLPPFILFPSFQSVCLPINMPSPVLTSKLHDHSRRKLILIVRGMRMDGSFLWLLLFSISIELQQQQHLFPVFHFQLVGGGFEGLAHLSQIFTMIEYWSHLANELQLLLLLLIWIHMRSTQGWSRNFIICCP